MYQQLLLAIYSLEPVKRCWKKRVTKKCKIEGCEKYKQKDGACIKHGAMLLQCKIEGCNNQSQTGEICFNDGATCKNVLLKDVIMYQ